MLKLESDPNFLTPISFNEVDYTIWLMIVYKKAQYDNLPTSFLAKLKEEVEYAIRSGKISK